MAKCNVNRKGILKHRTGDKTGGAIATRMNRGTESPTGAGPSLELRSTTTTFAPMCTSGDGHRGTNSRRRYRCPSEFLSSAAEWQRDGVKTVAAKVEIAKAGKGHFGCRAAQMRNRCPNVTSAGAAVEPS